jgi:hypothetical protein
MADKENELEKLVSVVSLMCCYVLLGGVADRPFKHFYLIRDLLI